MYVARSLTEAERRYSTIEKELLAVVFALKRCHFYMYGRPVTLMTDHRVTPWTRGFGPYVPATSPFY